MDPEQLYSLPPDEFTAARDAAVRAAKADGDKALAKDLGALRRPSVSAWLVNRLAAEQPALLEQLLELGPALAQAQAGRQADELRALGQQRRELVTGVVERAVDAAGRDVGSTVRAEVAGTLEAALADPASADAVRSGRLVRALSFAGFGGVDLDGAVASTPKTTTATASPGASRNVRPRRGQDLGSAERGGKGRGQKERQEARRVAEAEAAAHAAAGALDDAVRACERAEERRVEAEAQEATARAEVDRRKDLLAAAKQARKDAGASAKQAQQESVEAVERVQQAQAAEEAARATLDRLRRT